MKMENDIYNLIVEDNGVGMPADFDIDKNLSLGIELVKNLTNQIKGNLDIKSQNGTSCTVTFHDFEGE
jgi:two-component sensor histidine kinase